MVQNVNPRLYQDLNTLKDLGVALPSNPTVGLPNELSKNLFGQTVNSPVHDVGPVALIDGALVTKTGVGSRFGYSLAADQAVAASFYNITGVRNSTTGWQEVGIIYIPGDSANNGQSTVSFSVTASAPLANVQLAFSLGSRDNTARSQTKYYTVKDLGAGFALNTATVKAACSPVHSGMVKMDQVDAGTAPTAWPDNSLNRTFGVNLLGGLCVRLFVKFPTSANDTNLTAASGRVDLTHPARNLYDATTVYSKAPFSDNDVWKSVLPSYTVAKAEVITGAPNATGDQSTGTVSASGTAGSNVLTVVSTTGVTVGMRPMIGLAAVVNPGSGPFDPARPHLPNALDTFTAFGADVTVTQILSATQVQLSANLTGTVNLRGRVFFSPATDHVPCVAFYTATETASIRMGQGSGTITVNPFTGVQKTATAATVARSSVPILQIKSTDPLKTWRFTQVNAYNPWIFTTNAGNATIGFETFDNGTFVLRTPAISQSSILNGSQNPDRNLVLVTECGRYAVEMIGVDVSVSPATVTRVVVADLAGRSMVTPDVYDLSTVTYGTRAYGGPISGGVIRKKEMDECYSTGNIASDIYRAMNAVRHPVAILMSNAQGKSNNFCANPADQGTRTTYLSYRSSRSVHTPTVVAGGSGYAVGDALYVAGGTFTTQLSCVVTSVSSGAVTGVYVQRTGQYKTLPADGANLATTSSGAGTGCVLNVLNLPNAPDQTSLAIAFPSISSQAGVLQYPASVADSGYATNYASTVGMGSMFTLPTSLDLATEWTTRRTNAPTALSSSYELLAVLAAIQKYGAYVVDVSGSFQQMVVVDNDFANSAAYANLHGDVGSSTYPNYIQIKRLMTYVENVSPNNRSSVYNNPLPVLPPL